MSFLCIKRCYVCPFWWKTFKTISKTQRCKKWVTAYDLTSKRNYFFGVFLLLFRTFCALGAQGCPKAPRDCPGTPKVLKKVPKRSPKAIKMEPKVLENATKNTKRNSRWVYKKPTTNLKQWMPKSMKGGTVAEFRVSVTGYIYID